MVHVVAQIQIRCYCFGLGCLITVGHSLNFPGIYDNMENNIFTLCASSKQVKKEKWIKVNRSTGGRG